MKNADELLKRILLNMKYDPKMSLNENRNVILSEQSINVGGYYVSYDKEYNRVKIDSPSGKTYYWDPSGKWYKSTYYLGNEDNTDLDPTKDSKVISVLSNVFKKSGIGSNFYIKNKEQGDKFRQWVIKKDPSFATSIDLSKSGPYNNEYISKAWVKYGNQYKEQLKANKPMSSDDKQTQSVIADLKSKGFDASGAMSMNHAYALATVRATKKLTDKISERIFGAGDSPYYVCVKKVGSTCSPGSYLITDTFNMEMAEKINSKKDQNNPEGLKPPQYTLLTNFYFDWGKIMNDLTNTFKRDKNAYNSVLFPDGWWNWFTTYWGTDNATQITLSQSPKNIKVPGGGGGYPSGGLTSSDVHTFLTVVELGSMLLAFIPSPLSPVLWGISSAAGLADAATYYYEGDKYMGSMMLALEIIPGGELLKFFKGTKTAVKLGKEGSIELLEKGSKGTLEGNEKIVYKDLVAELKTIDKEIAQAAKKQIGKEIKENLTQNFIKATKNYSSIDKLKVFYQIIATVWKKIGSVPRMVISVGGTMVGIDKLYLALFGRDEDRQKSDIRKIYYIIQGKGLPKDEEINRLVGEAQKFIKENGSDEMVAGMIEVADKETLNKDDEFLRNKYANKDQIIKPQDKKPLFSSDDSKYGFGDLTTGDTETKITLKTKTSKEVLQNIEFEKLNQNKDKYDFYIWSKRKNKWEVSNFNDFREASQLGDKVNYTPKVVLNVNNQLPPNTTNKNKQKGFRFRTSK
jgi:hypothetical protein